MSVFELSDLLGRHVSESSLSRLLRRGWGTPTSTSSITHLTSNTRSMSSSKRSVLCVCEVKMRRRTSIGDCDFHICRVTWLTRTPRQPLTPKLRDYVLLRFDQQRIGTYTATPAIVKLTTFPIRFPARWAWTWATVCRAVPASSSTSSTGRSPATTRSPRSEILRFAL